MKRHPMNPDDVRRRKMSDDIFGCVTTSSDIFDKMLFGVI